MGFLALGKGGGSPERAGQGQRGLVVPSGPCQRGQLDHLTYLSLHLPVICGHLD